MLAQVYARIDRRLEVFQSDLFKLLRQKSISARREGIAECADLLASMMRERGIAVRILTVEDNPVVFGAIGPRAGAADAAQQPDGGLDPGRPTVLIYGHYDVQPVDPLDAWLSPPFEPVVRDGRVYARGAGDNKGQLFAHVCAVQAWREAAGALPCNVKFVFEGQEEMASPHLHLLPERHRDLLAADFVLTADGPIHDSGRPMLLFGVRGILKVELRARGASRDWHSGNRGGVAPNPAQALIDLIATMQDPATGRVRIPGFYDAVRPPTAREREVLAAIPFDREAALAELGIDEFPPPHDVSYHEKLMFLPTLNVAGFQSGYAGRGFKTVIPSEAVAKIDMRLVADQDPDDIWEKFRAHVARHAPHVQAIRLGHYHPSKTPVDNPFSELVIDAVRDAWGQEPIIYPCIGGSAPDSVWTRGLGVPSILVPYANPDESNHAPNENLDLGCFRNGIRTTAAIIDRLGRR